MPRYNLNQDDIDIIVEALNKRADVAWNPKDQARIKRLASRLQGKVDALDKSFNTEPLDKQQEQKDKEPVVYTDDLWNFYNKKDV